MGQASEGADQSIIAGRPFEDRQRYGLFLTVQYSFHRDIDALYANPVLDGLLPDLEGRRRLGLITQDVADLGLEPPTFASAPALESGADTPTALGWHYVAEGSNLGAAFLLKEVAKLGLSETFGARHLAPAPEGRGLHWRTFTAALDALEMSVSEEDRAIAGAEAAFRRVHGLVKEVFA
ncbi:biliverdin-producing heme oxygenase [Aminobacter anthyllidis]|uniref:Biliverdin-producing heme oxygenase n=1 Tax=Aminobacter anthyllidis TaxID=1035067 RepID=A0A9X1D3R6_9HYPH|nr:biliverdin-producing heme oxygenase [Aminobacter anthyllidis]